MILLILFLPMVTHLQRHYYVRQRILNYFQVTLMLQLLLICYMDQSFCNNLMYVVLYLFIKKPRKLLILQNCFFLLARSALLAESNPISRSYRLRYVSDFCRAGGQCQNIDINA